MMDIGFYIFSLIAIFSAIFAVSLKSIVRAVMSLGLFFFSVGCLYILLSQEFLGIVQILIYVGGVIILFLFLIMTTKIEPIKTNWTFLPAVVISCVLLFLIVWIFNKGKLKFTSFAPSSINEIGVLLMTKYLIPFEVVSLVLLVTLIGTICLLKKKD
ncbi:TPA: NADH-quinone oxidoreductase subunit J [bacterium]|nr:NADH-quinone oxidoreductase subunit J [bacterium]